MHGGLTGFGYGMRPRRHSLGGLLLGGAGKTGPVQRDRETAYQHIQDLDTEDLRAIEALGGPEHAPYITRDEHRLKRILDNGPGKLPLYLEREYLYRGPKTRTKTDPSSYSAAYAAMLAGKERLKDAPLLLYTYDVGSVKRRNKRIATKVVKQGSKEYERILETDKYKAGLSTLEPIAHAYGPQYMPKKYRSQYM
jgi:hypothetical protein